MAEYPPYLPVHRVVGWTKRRKHPYRAERYMQISFVGLEELQERMADGSFGRQVVRVLLAMMASCDYDNRVQAGQKDLARKLGMAQSHISTAINTLIAHGFVERGENYHARYVISPRFCWKGGEDTLRQALSERNLLDKDGYLRGRAA